MTETGNSPDTRPYEAPRPLAETYDVALLDLDGVVYLEGEPIPSARAAIADARERGMRFVFVTNNASRTPNRVAAALHGIGIAAGAEDVVTSAQAASRLVAERVPPGASVLVVGAQGLRLAVREQGLHPVTSARERPAAVVQGYDPRMSVELLAEGALAVRGGAVFVASNADTTLPSPRGPLPGNGAMVRVIATATGQEPTVAGKPELPLHREALARSAARRPLVVGDRLDTDIEGAVRGEADSLLVLTGVTDPAELVTAPPRMRPTYLARDLGGLLQPHPPARPETQGWSCGGWLARNAGGRLSLREDSSAENDPVDGLRALCAAAWGGPQPIDRAALSEALRAAPLS